MLSKSFVLLQVTYQLTSHNLLQEELMHTSFEAFVRTGIKIVSGSFI